MNETLKSCPFCGGMANLYRSGNLDLVTNGPDMFFIYCTLCGSRTDPNLRSQSKHKENWNRRVYNADGMTLKINPEFTNTGAPMEESND